MPIIKTMSLSSLRIAPDASPAPASTPNPAGAQHSPAGRRQDHRSRCLPSLVHPADMGVRARQVAISPHPAPADAGVRQGAARGCDR